MSKSCWFTFILLAVSIAAAGCGSSSTTEKPQAGPPGGNEDPKVKAALAKLGAEDRKLAEAQRLCPVSEEPLGSMGTPIKLSIKDEPVFICCKSCKEKALSDPDKTLATVKEFQ